MAKKKSKGSGIWKPIAHLVVGESFEYYHDEKYKEATILSKEDENAYTIFLKVITEGGSKVIEFVKESRVQLILIEPDDSKGTFMPRSRPKTFRGISIE